MKNRSFPRLSGPLTFLTRGYTAVWPGARPGCPAIHGRIYLKFSKNLIFPTPECIGPGAYAVAVTGQLEEINNP
jgi:hypothetical protein